MIRLPGSSGRFYFVLKAGIQLLARRITLDCSGSGFFSALGPTTVRDIAGGRPFHTWHHYAEQGGRGMSPWRDVVDWVGGLPFEMGTPEVIFDFYYQRGSGSIGSRPVRVGMVATSLSFLAMSKLNQSCKQP